MSTSTAIRCATDEATFHTRFATYLKARFPLLSHGVMVTSYVAANWAVARAATFADDPVSFAPRFIAVNVALVLFFFHLRVFDEHKDAEVDAVFHPERPVPSGVVSLHELRVAGGVAIALEFALACACGPDVVRALAVAFVYSVLMLREFFVAGWLRRHFVTYAVSHMLVMPLLALTVYSCAAARESCAAPETFALFVGAGFFAAFGWEVSRKLRTPDDEVEGDETYSSRLGVWGAAAAYVLVQGLGAACLYVVGERLALAPWFGGLVVSVFVGNVGAAIRFVVLTSRASAKLVNGFASLTLVGTNLATVIAVVGAAGVEWVR